MRPEFLSETLSAALKTKTSPTDVFLHLYRAAREEQIGIIRAQKTTALRELESQTLDELDRVGRALMDRQAEELRAGH